MAVYKVIQDIEAEDKLLGPLTLRQFIYAGICVVCLYLTFLVVTKHAAFLAVAFLPVALVCGFFAFPFKQDQPTEIWALARIRFMFKPHRRIWDQSGMKELVTITAPKKVVVNYTNGLSQTEVKSRLKALADTIDTRGWAIKNVNVNLYSEPQAEARAVAGSDRLVDAGALPQDTPVVDIQASDDILDTQNNPVAQNFDKLITESNTNRRQQIVQGLNQQTGGQNSGQPDDYWFLSQPKPSAVQPGSAMFNPQVVAPGTQDDEVLLEESADEKALAKQLKAQHDIPDPTYLHLRNVHPLSESKPVARNSAINKRENNANAPVTSTPDPDIVNLASDNDKNVETLGRMAKRQRPESSSPNEVVISLH
jgi:hypothetical protein